jgi:hypothetical protein
MPNNWTKVYTTSNMVEASIVVNMLLETDIEAVEMNKQDSSYLSFGLIEVYCHPEKVISALHLINSSKNENDDEK